jgi:predicted cobalt transporter CbtA
MKTLTFIGITLLSGAIAGTLLGLINQVVVEPFIDKAIGIEMQRHIAAGEIIDLNAQSHYRLWQKGGEIAAGAILGMSIAALFGIVFAYSRDSLPGHNNNNKKKALILGGIMFLVLFLVPALKYPANPPAVGDPNTISYRETLYTAILAISGFSALGLAFLYRKLGNKQSKKIIVPSIYAFVIASAYLLLPPNPDKITIPTDLIVSFRIASVFTMGIFWGLLGIILGLFWDKLKPHETSKLVSV